MSGEMFIDCKQYREPRDAIKHRGETDAKTVEMLHDAQETGETIQFADQRVSFTCSCKSNYKAAKFERISIRQILFIVTVTAVFLAVFRQPLQLMIEKNVWQAAVAPWSVYAALKI